MPANDKMTAARINADYTQLELAERTGLTENKISRLETGRSKPTDAEKEVIARILGRKQKDLF